MAEGALMQDRLDQHGRETDSASAPVLSAFAPYPDRAAAIGELHARPAMPVAAPATLYHLAFATTSEDAVEAIHRAAFDEPQDGFARHVMRASRAVVTKFERHTEFVSLTILSAEGPDVAEAPLRRLRAMNAAGIELLVAIRCSVVPKPAEPLEGLEIGGTLRGGIAVATALRPATDGYIDIRLAVEPMGAEQLGRRVQRVLEAETYRTMTLLGLPLARRIGAELSDLEAQLAEVTDQLVERGGREEAILERLQLLSARTEALRARTRYRFAASRAYAALVDERLDSLAEIKVGERPTLTGFLRTRLGPAIRTIASAEARLETLSASVGRALDFLRARVDVSLDKANQDILRSMNERQYRQLMISEAVESLSVIAISYYLLGILHYPLNSLASLGLLPVGETIALGILAPLVVVGVFALMRTVRHRWARRRPTDGAEDGA